MTRKLIVWIVGIVLMQLLGCAAPRHSTLVVIAEGQTCRTALKPLVNGFEPGGTAGASIRAEYHVWQ